ncbi:MAG: DUF6602 domain-containing protein [Sphingorhabdus sp.]
MTNWSLPTLLESLHRDVNTKLDVARASLNHPGTKGTASESVWLELLRTYLPKRYAAASAHIVDSKGRFSDQIDIVIFDRQYTPPIFEFAGYPVIPAESVYAVFEAKQSINGGQIAYAAEKVTSVRRLFRTNLPIRNDDGTLRDRKLTHILGGILAFESDWKPPLGQPLISALNGLNEEGKLDLGCVTQHGGFRRAAENFVLVGQNKPATWFILELTNQLQSLGTVPMIDVSAYAKWLEG